MSSARGINIASHLSARAATHPHQLGVVVPTGRDSSRRVAYVHLTYRQLDEESGRLARGLVAHGVGPGVRTVLMVPPSLEMFSLVFALFKAGAVPVMVDPGMGVRNLEQCLAEAEPHAFVGVTKAHVARTLLGWARHSVKTTVTVGRRLFWGGLSLDDVRRAGAGDDPFPWHPAQPSELAAILFTSGSTGVPKGAQYTHRMFESQVEIIRATYRIEPGEVDLATFPLFALFAPALGMSAIVPDMDATRPARVNPERILEAVDDFGVTNLFGSPALIDRVARDGAAHRGRLRSLRRVISAGAPMPPATLERFAPMLPKGVEVHTGYGATEAMPVSSESSATILGETRRRTELGGGVCVGLPNAGVEVAIVRIDDGPLDSWSDDLRVADGDIGEIVVRAPITTAGYFRRDESTRLARIRDGETHWHRMGDVGYRDPRGRIWYCGRKSHRVITSRGTLFTIPIEGILNTHEQVRRTALVGVGAVGAMRPVVCVELEPGVARSENARICDELRTLAAQHEVTRGLDVFLFHPGFPVDIRHNAKIFREKLAVWAAERA